MGSIASSPARRRTPAGSDVLLFRLRIEPSPHDPAVSGCVVPVVVLGESAGQQGLNEGSLIEVEGSLTERRWKKASGAGQSHFEILARRVRLL